MRNYEIAMIFHPELDEASLTSLHEKLDSWIAASGGEVVQADRWGKRRLAYPIQKQREGHYVFLYATMPPAAPQVVERNLRLTEDVLRFMITSVESIPASVSAAAPAATPATREVEAASAASTEPDEAAPTEAEADDAEADETEAAAVDGDGEPSEAPDDEDE